MGNVNGLLVKMAHHNLLQHIMGLLPIAIQCLLRHKDYTYCIYVCTVTQFHGMCIVYNGMQTTLLIYVYETCNVTQFHGYLI